MKTIRYIVIAAVSFCFFACTDFINVPTQGALDENAAYKNSTDAVMLTTGCYDILGAGWATEVPWMLGNLCADDTWKGGDGPNDQGELTEVTYFYAGTNNKFVEYRWRAHWMGIYRCNKALEKIPGIAMDDNLKNRLLGEAKFLRAFYYFELIKSFGDLPKITTPLEISKIKQPRVSKTIIYDEIIEKDLKEAAAILPQKDAYSSSDAGRATRGAALALLAKVHLYQKEWQDSYNAAKLVIDENKYSLEQNFRLNFEVDHHNGVESIFQAQQSNDQALEEGSILATMCRSRSDGGYGFDKPSSSLYYEFESGDPRLPLTITRNGDTVEGNAYPINDNSPYVKTMPYKFYVPKAKRVSNEWAHSAVNVNLIRYSDLLLIFAEAANELNKTDDALWGIEQVRNRARKMSSDPNVLPKVTTTNKAQILKAIQHERRVELASEYHRFWDIVRWGIAKETLDVFVAHNQSARAWQEEKGDTRGSLFTVGKHELLAIPSKDCDIAGWSNNPGY